MTTGLVYPDATNNVVGAIATNLPLVSRDDGDHWSIVDEAPQIGRPVSMTSTQAAGVTKLYFVRTETFDLGDGKGAQTYPHDLLVQHFR